MPLLVPYSCDIPDSKDMSTVHYSVAVHRPWARFVVTGENIISGKMASERSMRDKRMIRSRFLKIPRNDEPGIVKGNEIDEKRKRTVVNYC